jgi:PqqD family protein of HPr-rel-A system
VSRGGEAGGRLDYRRVGEGAVLFDRHTWQTHILTPAAAIIFETLLEASRRVRLSRDEALCILRRDLGVDPAEAPIVRLLDTLAAIGMICE